MLLTNGLTAGAGPDTMGRIVGVGVNWGLVVAAIGLGLTRAHIKSARRAVALGKGTPMGAAAWLGIIVSARDVTGGFATYEQGARP